MKSFIEFLSENKSPYPDSVIKAFKKLGNDQRGHPEYAMLAVQDAMGGGVLSPVVEHVGDITHRMSHHIEYDTVYPDIVAEKVKKGLRYLTDPYGFEREFNENIKSNALFKKKTEEQLRKDIDDKLKKYKDEHKKLIVYNEAQWFAREAAVGLGAKDWKYTILCLKKLDDMIKQNKFEKIAKSYKLDNNGNPKPYKK